MTKKSVCIMRRVALSLMIVTLVVGGSASFAPAYAAAGFTALKDIQSDAEKNTENRATPVLGLSIVFDPKAVAQAVKDYAIQMAMKQVQNLMNTNLVKGFMNTAVKLEDVSNAINNVIGAAAQEQNAVNTRIQDVENIAKQGAAIAPVVAENNRNAEAATAALCATSGDAAATNGTVVPPAEVGEGGHPQVARARAINQALRRPAPRGGAGIRAADIASSTVAKRAVDQANASNNSIGSQGDRGPQQQYIDDLRDMNEFTDSSYGYGAAGAAGVGSANNPRAGLDIRGDVLISTNRTPDSLTLYCTSVDKTGRGGSRLGATDIANCPSKTWEEMYVNKPLFPMPDLGVVLAKNIGYLMPPVLSPPSKAFYSALKRGDGMAAEINYKRKSYLNRLALVKAAFENIAADRVASGFGSEDDKKLFNSRFSQTYNTNVYPIPEMPSMAARRNMLVDYYQSQDYWTTIVSYLTGNGGADIKIMQMLAFQLQMQRDTLNTLRDISALLASSAGSDLFDDRDALERVGKSANQRQ